MGLTANATGPDPSPRGTLHPVYLVVAAALLASVLVCLMAVAIYFRRRARLDQLRHRLLPLYTYDPAEQEEDWGEEDEEEERLEESLLKKRQLAFTKEE
ncbi:unnamed protein product [Boreogadus saida]